MEKSYYLSMTFNNIVFRGRNQAYGAYYLRRKYSKHVLLASTLATAIFSGALVGPLVDTIFFSDPVKYEQPTYTILEPTTIYLPEPPAPDPKPEKADMPPPAPEKEAKTATEKYTDVKVVSNSTETTDDVPDQSRLSEVNIGKEKIEGDIPEVPAVSMTEAPPVGIESGEATSEKSEPFIYVDQMPQFKGGTGDLMKYLGRKLRYPTPAQNAGIEGTVVVTFVVGITGEITDVQVLKGLGFGTEEEATRVVESMPKWEPGRQNGRAVPVRYTLPIRFKIN